MALSVSDAVYDDGSLTTAPTFTNTTRPLQATTARCHKSCKIVSGDKPDAAPYVHRLCAGGAERLDPLAR